MVQTHGAASGHSRPSLPAQARAPLSAVVYRSRAARDLSPLELHDLTVHAQTRNGREQLTGLMLYDDQRFFQWLEGPGDGVGRVMQSIMRDTRHGDIEILLDKPAQTRAFAEWTMKLAAPGPTADVLRRDVITLPRAIVEDLRRHPDAAPVLLVKLRPAAAREEAGLTDTESGGRLDRATADALKRVIVNTLVPRLVQEHRPLTSPERALPVSNRAKELAELLVGTDAGAPVELIREVQAGRGAVGPLFATLFEPAARALGDLWSDDTATDFDITIALCRLQTAARLLSADSRAPLPRGAGLDRLAQPVVLIAPEPGELHRLGAALDSEVLWDAGWAPHTEFPDTNQALQDLLAGTWVDVLDLSLSTVFRRDHWLPRMRATILQAREASQNPALVVVVGGRVFTESASAGAAVGADVTATTAWHVDQLMLEGLESSARGTSALKLG